MSQRILPASTRPTAVNPACGLAARSDGSSKTKRPLARCAKLASTASTCTASTTYAKRCAFGYQNKITRKLIVWHRALLTAVTAATTRVNILEMLVLPYQMTLVPHPVLDSFLFLMHLFIIYPSSPMWRPHDRNTDGVHRRRREMQPVFRPVLELTR